MRHEPMRAEFPDGTSVTLEEFTYAEFLTNGTHQGPKLEAPDKPSHGMAVMRKPSGHVRSARLFVEVYTKDWAGSVILQTKPRSFGFLNSVLAFRNSTQSDVLCLLRVFCG